MKKSPILALAAALCLLPNAKAEDDHDHELEHEREYFDEGHADIALVYHEDEGELEFALFGEHDHDEHEHAHEEHADEEHADDSDHEHADEEHADEEEHTDADHADEEHADDHEHADEEHDHGEGIELGEAVLLAGANTEFTLPESGDFDFLGEAGSTVYILPQDPTAGPVAPGLSMEFEDGVFVNNQATITLVALEGPGDLVAYQIDGFGEVSIVFNTRDGLTEADTYTGLAESHEHLNWAFTEPGIYHLEFEAGAQLASDESQLIAEGELMVQVGAGASYLREIDAYEDGWAETENLGMVYSSAFPWLYMPLLKGWAFAEGEGGEAMLLYPQSMQAWVFTGDELAPWVYRFDDGTWYFVFQTEAGEVYVYNSESSLWTLLP